MELLKMKSYLLLAFLPHIALSGDRWNVTLAGGDMRFQGLIVAEACSINTGDQQMTVNLGKVSSNRFNSTQEYIEPVSFYLHLQECNTNISQLVRVGFSGVADRENPDVLSVGEGPGMAKGVGVALFDEKENLMPINNSGNYAYHHYTGNRTIHIIAKYKKTNYMVTAGAVNAQAWFSLTYQ